MNTTVDLTWEWVHVKYYMRLWSVSCVRGLHDPSVMLFVLIHNVFSLIVGLRSVNAHFIHLNALINFRWRIRDEWRGIRPHTPTASAAQPLPEEQWGLGWTSQTMRKFILQRGCGCECGLTFPALTGSCALRLWTWAALGVHRSVACLSVGKIFCTS